MRYPLTSLLSLLLLVGLSVSALAMSTEEEIKLGAEASARFEKEYGLVNDPVLVDRLNRISKKLLVHADRQDLPWKFSVIDIEEFNAAAFPGGFIYATKGLMNGLTDEELAFVMGHEIGHVDERHSVKQLESSQLRRIGLIVIAAGAGKGKISDQAGTLVGLTDAVIGSQYSQADESSADRYGMRRMALAGFDPAFALAALQKLSAQSGGGTPGFLNTLIGSHPLPAERLKKGAELIVTVPFRPQAIAPVTQPSSDDRIFSDATHSLEYTLSLLGNNHRASLDESAANVALRGYSAPANTRLVRVKSPRAEGLSGLENRLLRHPDLKRVGQIFGAVVVNAGGGNIEAVVLLQGGR